MKSKHGFNGNWDGIVRNDKLIAEQNVNPWKEVLKPVTICDILSEPSPDHLRMLMQSDYKASYWAKYLLSKKLNAFGDGVPERPKWVDDLYIYREALLQWFEQEGGSKEELSTKIFQMASCKNKAPWASWSGTAWRGLWRSAGSLNKYKITDVVVQNAGASWLIASTAYKSEYPIQSWTDNFAVARKFTRPRGGGRGCGVILEISISKEEGFLSPKASNKINTHPSGGSGWSGGLLRSKESEVLRCSNKETTVKAYINMNDLANMIVDTINLHGDKEETYLEMGTGILKIYFGSSLAKKLMSSSHPFRKSFLSALPK